MFVIRFIRLEKSRGGVSDIPKTLKADVVNFML